MKKMSDLYPNVLWLPTPQGPEPKTPQPKKVDSS